MIMKNETEQLKKATANLTKDSEVLTFDNFEEIHAAGQPESIASLNLPEIDPSLLEEQYRVQTTTPAEHPSPITGNKPFVADVAKLPQTANAVETDNEVVADILASSPLAEVGLVSKYDETEPIMTERPVSNNSPRKSFWGKLFGGQ